MPDCHFNSKFMLDYMKTRFLLSTATKNVKYPFLWLVLQSPFTPAEPAKLYRLCSR